jgi:hypothetical protein
MPTRLVVTRASDFVEFRKECVRQGIHQRFEEQVHIINTSWIERLADAPNPQVPCDPLDRTLYPLHLRQHCPQGRPAGC